MVLLSHPDVSDPAILNRIAERLKREYGAKQVIVYGSVTRGKATIHSDIDLLIVAPTDDSMYWRVAKVLRIIRGLSSRLPVSPIILTPGELDQRLEIGDPFIREILAEGIPL